SSNSHLRWRRASADAPCRRAQGTRRAGRGPDAQVLVGLSQGHPVHSPSRAARRHRSAGRARGASQSDLPRPASTSGLALVLFVQLRVSPKGQIASLLRPESGDRRSSLSAIQVFGTSPTEALAAPLALISWWSVTKPSGTHQ